MKDFQKSREELSHGSGVFARGLWGGGGVMLRFPKLSCGFEVLSRVFRSEVAI